MAPTGTTGELAERSEGRKGRGARGDSAGTFGERFMLDDCPAGIDPAPHACGSPA